MLTVFLLKLSSPVTLKVSTDFLKKYKSWKAPCLFTNVTLYGVCLSGHSVDTVMVFLVVPPLSFTTIVELFAGMVTYCIFWLELPLSVMEVVLLSITTLLFEITFF